MKGYIVYTTEHTLNWIYIGCGDDVCFLHVCHVWTIADFRMLGLSKCWIPLFLHPFSGSLLQHPISVATWPKICKQKIYGFCLHLPWIKQVASWKCSIKEILSSNHWFSEGVVLHAFAVCFREDIHGYTKSLLWEKPEVSKCLVICFIEVPKFVTLKLHVDESHRSYKGFWKWCPWRKKLAGDRKDGIRVRERIYFWDEGDSLFVIWLVLISDSSLSVL